MRASRWIICTLAVLSLVAFSLPTVVAQNYHNPGIYQQLPAPISTTLRFWASDAGKNLLLHSPSPFAFPLLQHFHPEAASQYPLQPMMHRGPVGATRPAVSVTGCGTDSGTVMNLEPAALAVSQTAPSVDFLLSELGSGKDLVVESGNDERGTLAEFDSMTAIYVHRDASQPCYGGSDFEMGNPPIADPFYSGTLLTSLGIARVLADPNPSRKQFIFADLRSDNTTRGIGLRRIPASNFESTSTCPSGTLNRSQEATCAGTRAILVDASLDNDSDSVSIAQDPRSSGTGAGDIYVVHASLRDLRTVIVVSACKATFTTSSDCSSSLIISGSQIRAQFPSVAVVGGGPNAGAIAISWLGDDGIDFVSCTPAGAPNRPTCNSRHLVKNDPNLYSTLTDYYYIEGLVTWPVIAARTDSGGQTIFIVWSDCKVVPFSDFPLEGCPDADIVMEVGTSLSSPSFAFHHITTASGHQIIPSIAYDSGQNMVNIAYYTSKSDIFKNSVVMAVNQIPGGSITPGSTAYATSTYDSLSGDGTSFLFGNPGDYMGLAAHGGSGTGSSRLYLGFTNNSRQGTYSGISNTQADNNVSRVTY